MKTILSLLLLITCLNFSAHGQGAINTGTGFHFQLNQYQRDFGLGLSVTSPMLANDNLGIRIRGNLMFYEHVKNGTTTWSPYANMTLGLIGIGGTIADFIRLYGEGGVVFLMPAESFTNEDFVIGGYGLFGFEFFMDKGINYFIEIGGVGTGAVADKIPAEPIYSNGLVISTGFRFYLR